MSSQADSLKSVLFALGANLSIALAKTGGAVYTGSSSMLAEAIHSFADCGNQGLLLWGMKAAQRPATPAHPLGHGRAIYVWSFLVALMLFSMGGLFSIYEGVHKLHDDGPMENAWVALAILGFSLCAESVSLWGALREIKKDANGLSLWQWFRRSRQSEMVVVVGEDVAALGGLAIAFGFILVAQLTGNPVYDAIGSIAIGVLLVIVAVLVGYEVAVLLIGEGVEPQVQDALCAHVRAQPEVGELFNLLTQQLGNDVMVAVKARIKPQGSEEKLIAAINRVEQSMRAAFPQIRWIFFEPDLHD